ncbi:MAG: helix-turn-helix transcriptional regulator [Myxococcales bacterium]|nr:helix-turn-helix transcriptional regulator [Myxococcales bacterium]MCB9641771.1 helix-turn-helix transcriptional regulator [Myxococcales bacterium]
MDRRVLRTRRLLVDALFALVEERGYEPLTIQEIAERAGVHRATFYAHFQTKEELLLAGLEMLFEELAEEIVTSEKGLSFMRSTDAALLTYRHILRKGKLYQSLLSEHELPHVSSFFLSVTSRFTLQKLDADFGGNVPQAGEWVGWCVGGVLYGLVRRWLQGGMVETPEEMAELTTRLLWDGALKVLEGDKKSS